MQHCVRWGRSPPKGHSPPPFSAHGCCGQTAGWIMVPLGTEAGLNPSHIVLDGNPLPAPPRKGHSSPPLFGPCLLSPNGRSFQQPLSSCCASHIVVLPGMSGHAFPLKIAPSCGEISPYLMHNSLSPLKHTTQMAFQLVQPFVQSSQQSDVRHARACPLLKDRPFTKFIWGSGRHLIHASYGIGPTEVHNPNGIAICSAIFAQLMCGHALELPFPMGIWTLFNTWVSWVHPT